MKSKLLILSLLFWVGSFAQSVPNSSVLSLRNDVYPVVHSHAPSTIITLNSVKANAVDTYYDLAYKGDKSSQLNFRNYTIPTEPCSSSQESGSEAYPTIRNIQLGTNTGNVVLSITPYSQPDRFIVIWNGSVKFDTGYWGTSDYTYGGSLRSLVVSYLSGKVDPITLNTYPFSHANNSADGYPIVQTGTPPTFSFNKNLSTPTLSVVNVYSSSNTTLWSFTLSCPQ